MKIEKIINNLKNLCEISNDSYNRAGYLEDKLISLMEPYETALAQEGRPSKFIKIKYDDLSEMLTIAQQLIGETKEVSDSISDNIRLIEKI